VKALAIWVVIVGVVFAAFAVVTTVLRDTSRVFVVVDSSFPMTAVWSQVPEELDDIDKKDHAEFALATEKATVHGWEPALTLTAVEPFAPCTFDSIANYPEVAEADELILVTTGASCDTSQLTDWMIVNLSP
jgi:hypothetical protein